MLCYWWITLPRWNPAGQLMLPAFRRGNVSFPPMSEFLQFGYWLNLSFREYPVMYLIIPVEGLGLGEELGLERGLGLGRRLGLGGIAGGSLTRDLYILFCCLKWNMLLLIVVLLQKALKRSYLVRYGLFRAGLEGCLFYWRTFDIVIYEGWCCDVVHEKLALERPTDIPTKLIRLNAEWNPMGASMWSWVTT